MLRHTVVVLHDSAEAAHPVSEVKMRNSHNPDRIVHRPLWSYVIQASLDYIRTIRDIAESKPKITVVVADHNDARPLLDWRESEHGDDAALCSALESVVAPTEAAASRALDHPDVIQSVVSALSQISGPSRVVAVGCEPMQLIAFAKALSATQSLHDCDVDAVCLYTGEPKENPGVADSGLALVRGNAASKALVRLAGAHLHLGRIDVCWQNQGTPHHAALDLPVGIHLEHHLTHASATVAQSEGATMRTKQRLTRQLSMPSVPLHWITINAPSDTSLILPASTCTHRTTFVEPLAPASSCLLSYLKAPNNIHLALKETASVWSDITHALVLHSDASLHLHCFDPDARSIAIPRLPSSNPNPNASPLSSTNVVPSFAQSTATSVSSVTPSGPLRVKSFAELIVNTHMLTAPPQHEPGEHPTLLPWCSFPSPTATGTPISAPCSLTHHTRFFPLVSSATVLFGDHARHIAARLHPLPSILVHSPSLSPDTVALCANKLRLVLTPDPQLAPALRPEQRDAFALRLWDELAAFAAAYAATSTGHRELYKQLLELRLPRAVKLDMIQHKQQGGSLSAEAAQKVGLAQMRHNATLTTRERHDLESADTNNAHGIAERTTETARSKRALATVDDVVARALEEHPLEHPVSTDPETISREAKRARRAAVGGAESLVESVVRSATEGTKLKKEFYGIIKAGHTKVKERK